MAKELLIVIGMVVFAVAFRSCRMNWSRKLGAFIFLIASFLLFYFVADCLCWGLLGIGVWFLLPWIEILGRVRKLRLPMENRLVHKETPEDGFFPNASQALAAMSEAHFEHVGDAAWSWAGMEQHFLLHWNPEEQASAAVCLCEQDNVAFAFISITSKTEDGRTYRTTNFPFSPTLRSPSNFFWNHVPCEKNSFHQILKDHQAYLKRQKIAESEWSTPDPERLEDEIEEEMRLQIQHNLDQKIIEPADGESFRYSTRGFFFLWKQFVKDMLRLC